MKYLYHRDAMNQALKLDIGAEITIGDTRYIIVRPAGAWFGWVAAETPLEFIWLDIKDNLLFAYYRAIFGLIKLGIGYAEEGSLLSWRCLLRPRSKA